MSCSADVPVSPNTAPFSFQRCHQETLEHFSWFHAQLWMVGEHKLARALLHWVCFYWGKGQGDFVAKLLCRRSVEKHQHATAKLYSIHGIFQLLDLVCLPEPVWLLWLHFVFAKI
jgi:hypothetical protein